MSQLEVDKIIPQSGTTLTIGDSGDTVNFADGTALSIDTNTLYIDSTNNRVGIGTASPSEKLHIYDGFVNVDTTGSALLATRYTSGSGSTNLNLYKSQSDTIGTHTALSNGSGIGAIITRGSDGASFIKGTSISSQVDGTVSTNSLPTRITFSTNSGSTEYSERMRIDSSGNFMVGKTTSNYTSPGVEAKSNGNLIAVRDSGNVVNFVRNTNDGSIVTFSKDTTNFASIGVNSGDNPYFSGLVANHGGVMFSDAGASQPTMFPVSSGSTLADNAVNIGASSYRYKDLYLGGGLYVGGTGSANKLDDYEEGTWTPSLNSGTASQFYATYTKIGNQCTLHFYLQNFSDTTSSTDIVITGLPFTQDTVGTTVVGVGSAYGERFDYNARTVVISGQNIRIRDGLGVSNFSDSLQYVDNNNGSDSALIGTVTYQTT